MLQPLRGLRGPGATVVQNTGSPELQLKKITSLADLESQLQAAEGRYVVLDFWAISHGTHHFAMHLHHDYPVGSTCGTHHRATPSPITPSPIMLPCFIPCIFADRLMCTSLSRFSY